MKTSIKSYIYETQLKLRCISVNVRCKHRFMKVESSCARNWKHSIIQNIFLNISVMKFVEAVDKRIWIDFNVERQLHFANLFGLFM